LVPEFEQRVEKQFWNRRSWASRRDALAIALGLCGLRWIEVSRLRRVDVSPEAAEVHVRSAKGGRYRRIPVGVAWVTAMRDVLAVAERRWGRRPKQDRLFFTKTGYEVNYTAVRRRCKQWTVKVFGIPYTFHCLRHTFAVRRYHATGGDVLEVSRSLGHQSLQWTQEYLRQIVEFSTDGFPGFVEGSGGPALRLFDPDKAEREEGPGHAA